MKNILRPTRVKILIHLLLSLGYVLAIIFLPVSGFSRIFFEFTLSKKILSFLFSWLAGFVIYYPLTFSVAYLISSVKSSLYIVKEIILALVFIFIFNPFMFSFAFSHMISQKAIAPINNATQDSVQTEPVCGLRINDFTAGSKVEAAGIGKGDIIMKFNGAEMKSVQDIFTQLAKKKPGDKVNIETNKGLGTVELIKNANDPNASALGVMLEPSSCNK